MIGFLLVGLALAEPGALPPYPVLLTGGLGGGAASPSPFGDGGGSWEGHVHGRIGLCGPRTALEFGVREGMATQDLRSLGGIFVGARWAMVPGVDLRAGFAHHHEVEYALARSEPVLAVLGSLDGIRHRSGAELGLSLRATVPDRALKDRLGGGVDLSAVVFPDEGGPRAYGFIDLSVHVAAGARRGGTTPPAPPPGG